LEPEESYEEETDVEELESVVPGNPGEPTPLTHKFKSATVSIFKSVKSGRHREMETVINQMPIRPQHPKQTWKFTWRDIGNTVPESHINNIMEIHFDELRTFMQQAFTRAPAHFPLDDLPYIIEPDSPASVASSALSGVPDDVYHGPGYPPLNDTPPAPESVQRKQAKTYVSV
jgi:hypothetical protein